MRNKGLGMKLGNPNTEADWKRKDEILLQNYNWKL